MVCFVRVSRTLLAENESVRKENPVVNMKTLLLRFIRPIISGGTENVPIEEVKAMYDEMKTEFDYVLVSEYPLIYRGKYEGETNFVDGYEQYQSGEISNPVNVVCKPVIK